MSDARDDEVRDLLARAAEGAGGPSFARQPRERNEDGPEWGEELTGRLVLPDGRALFVRDSAGHRGHGQLGPLLRTPPLSREQLRALMLRPEVVADR
ncbi:hypothetical protein PEM37_06795 [Streptomyces sp. AD681]|uniref:hypothetical protein n=1 Tax=Streptomyces sp. AD681 TaxID=3019069 RepID=UPI0022F16A73|nr:hypothetical protein [Streptomyces sp. AD681]MDA5141209.1 hypothetical protein [Streptomyces sp. AD681]